MLNYLNIHYGVCFGFVFSLIFFQVSGEPEKVAVRFFHMDLYMVFAFCIMVIYLFLDWVHAIKYRTSKEEAVNWNWLAIYSLFIWIVGAICASVIADIRIAFPMLIAYSFVISVYDFILTRKYANEIIFKGRFTFETGRSILLGLTALGLLAFSLFMTMAYYLVITIGKSNLFSIQILIAILSVVLLLNKIARFAFEPEIVRDN